MHVYGKVLNEDRQLSNELNHQYLPFSTLTFLGESQYLNILSQEADAN